MQKTGLRYTPYYSSNPVHIEEISLMRNMIINWGVTTRLYLVLSHTESGRDTCPVMSSNQLHVLMDLIAITAFRHAINAITNTWALEAGSRVGLLEWIGIAIISFMCGGLIQELKCNLKIPDENTSLAKSWLKAQSSIMWE